MDIDAFGCMYREAISSAVMGGCGSRAIICAHFEVEATTGKRVEVELDEVANSGEVAKAESGTSLAQTRSRR